MKWSGSLPVSSRRAFVALGAAAVLCAASSLKAQPGGMPAVQTPPAQTPAQPPDPLKFNTDSPVLIVFSVKPEKVADFEAYWVALRAAFAKSTNAEQQAFGQTLKVYKVDFASVPGQPAPPAGTPVAYVQIIDAPSKTFTASFTRC